MKVVIAMDSFKGSLSSLQAGSAAAEGIRRVFPDAQIEIFPIADGGEGTVDALVTGLKGEKKTVCASDPLGRPISCCYGILPDGTAVIEIACAAGITLLEEKHRDPMNTTTWGVGQVIADAISCGCRDFIIGIGGSATNDGGIGMLQALGFGILDQDAKPVPPGGRGLEKIAAITTENALPELSACTFHIACDVKNPLCGAKGCSAVYGPQKGASPEAVAQLDAWLSDYADLVRNALPHADKNMPGAGAAGGLGFAFSAFLGAQLVSGIELILHRLDLQTHIREADLVITGEGRLDGQTVMGKAPAGVAKIAKMYHKPVIAFAGCLAQDARVCNELGIDAYFSIARGPGTVEAAMEPANAEKNLAEAAQQIFRLLRLGKNIPQEVL